MNRNLLLGLSLAAALALTGCADQPDIETTADTLTPVKVTTVQTGSIRITDTFSGNAAPITEVDVFSGVPGEVADVYFAIGDSVNEKDVLFTMDERAMANNVKALESQVASAQASVDAASLNVSIASGSQARTQLTQMKSSLDSAEINYGNAKTTYDNSTALYNSGYMSKADYDGAAQAYQLAKTNYEALQESYRLLTEKQLGESVSVASSQLKQAQASRNALSVQLDNAQDSLDDAAVESPISGTVAHKHVVAGELYSGTMPAYTIINTDQVTVTFNVPENRISGISNGVDTTVYFKALDREFRGTVTEVSPVPTEQTLTYPVKVTISNPDRLIQSGMYANITLTKAVSTDTVVVDRNHLEQKDGLWTAYVVENGAIKVIRVTTGLDNGRQIEVTDGLTQGQQLVTLGRAYISDLEPVTIID